jgi:hypothetical protein
MPDVNMQLTEAVATSTKIPSLTSVSSSLAAEIDTLGAMEAEYKAANALVAAYDSRVKMLAEQLEQHALGDQPLRTRGEKYEAGLSEPAQTRFVKDLPEVVRLLTAKVFLQYAKFNVGDVEALLPPDKAAKVIDFKRGNRKLKLLKI